MHSFQIALRTYEAFAFRDGKFPHRLAPEQRDQFVAEAGAYLRLVGAAEEDIPANMAELGALYERYADLFEPTTTGSCFAQVRRQKAESRNAARFIG